MKKKYHFKIKFKGSKASFKSSKDKKPDGFKYKKAAENAGKAVAKKYTDEFDKLIPDAQTSNECEHTIEEE